MNIGQIVNTKCLLTVDVYVVAVLFFCAVAALIVWKPARYENKIEY